MAHGHKPKLLTFFLLLSFGLMSQSLTIKGKLADADSMNVLPKATIRLSPASDTSRGRMYAADDKGLFKIGELRAGKYILTFTFTGYNNGVRTVTLANTDLDLGEVLLVKKEKTLSDVTVVGRIPPARQKGDTTEINAAALKVNPDATAEEMLRKAPGVTIENGQVTAQGEQVRRVTIDGRQFFGDDATAALRNLPAEVIDKIQVFDRMSDQAQLTGFSDGNETKAINIVTKANMRNGQFGRIYAGYGTDERYAAGGSVNIFKKDTRLNLVGLFNNVNQQNFSGEDLLGISGAANQGRGGGRGGPGGGGGGRPGGWGGGGGNSFQVGQQPGIARTNAFGVNYSDLFLNKKMEVSGSYFFNNSRTTARTTVNRQLFLPGDTSQYYSEENRSTADNWNHRINARMEYKIDSNNTLIYSPNISFQKNKTLSQLIGKTETDTKALINSTLTNRDQSGDGYNIRNELTYRRAFAKKGRSFSINLNHNLSRRESENYLSSISAYAKTGSFETDTTRQVTDNLNKGYSLSTNLAWSEPLSATSQLQFNYNPTFSKNNADQGNLLYDKATNDYTILDTSLSNLFDNNVTTQRAGINYRIGDRDKQFSAGVDYQNTLLTSEQTFPVAGNVRKTFNNILPNLMWRKQINKQTNLRLGYRASVNTPSVNQLQNVVNFNNPLFLSSGNPDLDNSYTHFLYSRLNVTNTVKGTSMFAGLFLQKAQDYITNGTYVASQDSTLANGIVLRQGSQLSKPVNLDGYYSVRGFMNYGFPLKAIKSNLNLSAGANYSRTPGLVNNVENLSHNYNYNLGINIGSNISERIDFNVNYSANFNNVRNTIQSELNNKYYYHNTGLKVNLLTKSGFFILNDITNQLYTGLADGFNQSFWLWNVSAGKKFLKNRRGEVKLSVFDLLEQNQSISRNVADTYIEDVQTVVLQQYFMLTFTYTLRNFGQAARNGSAERGTLRSPN